jgi:predicted P-loop ATPase
MRNRRFLCFEVTVIDYKHKVSLEAVYAQFLDLFRNGSQYWFSPSDILHIDTNNEQYRNLAVEEELLTYYFEPCKEDQADYFFCATELINWLTDKAKISPTDNSKNKMGKALTAAYLRLKKHGRYSYVIKEKVYIPSLPVNGLSTKNLVGKLFW